jgi:hypothetical protein
MCIDDEMDALGGVLWKTHIPLDLSYNYVYVITRALLLDCVHAVFCASECRLMRRACVLQVASSNRINTLTINTLFYIPLIGFS